MKLTMKITIIFKKRKEIKKRLDYAKILIITFSTDYYIFRALLRA